MIFEVLCYNKTQTIRKKNRRVIIKKKNWDLYKFKLDLTFVEHPAAK
jgi:hypothetical protein